MKQTREGHLIHAAALNNLVLAVDLHSSTVHYLSQTDQHINTSTRIITPHSTMTELSPDLKAFYEPWTVRNITPSVAGRPQPFFFHRDARITRILTGRFHIAAMRRAIALARQLMFSKVGRNIAGSALSEAQTRLAANDPLPAPVHGLRSVPDHLMQRIDEISSREEWTYVIILQAPGNLLGQVHRDRPREICLSFPVSHLTFFLHPHIITST